MAPKMYTLDASVAWNMLNGIFVIFKPANLSVKKTRGTIIKRLCEDLNSMKVRKPTKYVSIEGETNDEMKVVVSNSYADHVLTVGPRYQPQDVKLSTANYLSPDASGVLLCGINNGTKLIKKIQDGSPIKLYRVRAILGQATDNYFKTGKIIESSGFKHVKRIHLDRICAAMQSSHQRKMFELSGVHIQSQAAYELATQGLVRPSVTEIPLVYSIKCIDFQPPECQFEIVCVNEYDMYLKSLIHNLGLQLHSTATCTQIQCLHYGLFHLDLALLSKHWDLECIMHNIWQCKEIINKNQSILHQENAILKKDSLSS